METSPDVNGRERRQRPAPYWASERLQVTGPVPTPEAVACERSERVTAAAFCVIRRAIVDGVPVT